MKIAKREIVQALFELAQENPKNIKKIVEEFYSYLLHQKKTKILPFIFEELDKIEKEKQGIKEIEIESTHPLSDEQKEEIKNLFKAKKVIIQEKINPRLIGGIIIKTDDKIFDASIKSNLERLKEEMWQTPIR